MEIVGSLFNVIGFVVLIDTNMFRDLYYCWTGKIDEMGRMSRPVRMNNDFILAIEYKYKQPIGFLLLLIGNILLLISSVIK
jgi:hypothetical protein